LFRIYEYIFYICQCITRATASKKRKIVKKIIFVLHNNKKQYYGKRIVYLFFRSRSPQGKKSMFTLIDGYIDDLPVNVLNGRKRLSGYAFVHQRAGQ
jgi:hypothetical protein